MRKKNRITLTWTMDCGAAGCDADECTPLARAVRQLFEDGKPFPNLGMSFFREPTGTLRWIGVFLQSVAGRIIFFPGWATAYDQIRAYQGNALRWQQVFDFDHMSLEKDRTKWHVTATRSTAHLGSPRTLPLGQDRVLWMGISIAEPAIMRRVMTETRMSFKTPSSDIHRRMSIFDRARMGAKFPIMTMNDEHPVPFDEWFLHLGVIAGPKGFEFYGEGELGFPVGSPFLHKPLPDRLMGLPIRSHRIELSEETDLQITVCPVPGRLTTPVSITSPSAPVMLPLVEA